MDIVVDIIKDNQDFFIFSVFVTMLIFAMLEYQSLKQKDFKDYKPIIISIGVLGTFIGIFCGLWNFNTSDITQSVPPLLEGLKLAFITSILGMLVSIILSVIENKERKLYQSEGDNSNGHLQLEILRSISSEQKEANQKLETLKSIFTEQQKTNQKLEMLKLIASEQQKTNQNTSAIHQSIAQLGEGVNKHFSIVNESLKQALDALSKGATEEIIAALKTVISDFNNNLTEQFGDNFKQLNESVGKMIVWQENYKIAITQIESNLQNVLDKIEKVSVFTQQFASDYQSISEVSKDLKVIIETNQNQINNMEVHMKSLKKIGEEAGLITKSIDEFSKSIQDSLSNQSKGLDTLSDKLNDTTDKTIQRLGDSLGKLNETLTTLTNKFRKDYEVFLQYIREISRNIRE